MKCLVIGGNRFVGLRLGRLLEGVPGVELHILNRTGQAPHCKSAVVHKGDRRQLEGQYLDRDWDLVYDFAGFNEGDAESAIKFFKKVSRYVFISTACVYDAGADLKEEKFDAKGWDLSQPPPPDAAYPDGKRRAEATFAQRAPFPVLSVRFPVILGPDDYTERLKFHRDRVATGEPLYIPTLAARVSMIQAEDAARFLLWAHDKELSGPLNVASSEPISMGDLLSQVEISTGRRPNLAKEATEHNRSPYAPDGDWYMNMNRLVGAGFRAQPIEAWLPDLLGRPAAKLDDENAGSPLKGRGFLH